MTVTIESSTDSAEEVQAAIDQDAKDRGQVAEQTVSDQSSPDPEAHNEKVAAEAKAKGEPEPEQAPVQRSKSSEVSTDADDDKPEPKAEAKAKAKAGEDEDEDDAEGEEAPKRSLRGRINKLTREKYAAEARAEAAEAKTGTLESRLAALEARLAGDTPPKAVTNAEVEKEVEARAGKPEKEPDRDDFEDFDDYLKAVIRYERGQESLSKEDIRKEVKAELEAAATEQAKAQAREQGEELVTAYQDRYKAASEAIEDFDDMIEKSASLPMSDAMKEMVVLSEVGPLLLYVLAHEPEECERIASLSDTQAAAALGRLEARIEAESSGAADTSSEGSQNTREPLVSRAPKPITPVGGRAVSTSGEDDEKRDWRQWADERTRREMEQMSR